MKNFVLVLTMFLTFGAGRAFAQVHDWHDLHKVKEHVNQAIHELENARHANHYDMDGHGQKAENLLHRAQEELRLAIEAMKNGR